MNLSEEFRNLLPPRVGGSHKGTYGRLLCAVTAEGMAGAGYLCSLAAYRCGVGLVDLLAPECNREILQVLLPEAVFHAVGKMDPKTVLIPADAIVAGPGLSRSEEAKTTVRDVLSGRDGKPCALDADALNIVSEDPSLSPLLRGCVITPHFGEASRLSGLPIAKIAEDDLACARLLCEKYGCVSVLKSHRTLVVSPDGDVYRNETGNSGMSTAGSGDVLAGILGACLAYDRPKDTASLFADAVRAVKLHAAAGDRAALLLGENAVMARDIACGIDRSC